MRTNNSPLPAITIGRAAIEKQITEAAAAKLKEFGISLIDVRFMRINYSPAVTAQINQRMISERKQIANRYRSEGEGAAAKILGDKERDLQEIQSEAYKEVQQIKGRADAQATEIYAKAYNQEQGNRRVLRLSEDVGNLQANCHQRHHHRIFHRQRPLSLPENHRAAGQEPVKFEPFENLVAQVTRLIFKANGSLRTPAAADEIYLLRLAGPKW